MQEQKYLSLKEAAGYLGLSLSAMYKMTMGKTIPHFKPGGKIIYIDKRDLDKFIQKNRISSKDEMRTQAANYSIIR